MTSVTQTVPTFLGGVSKQPDIKKNPGQMSEITNGIPDPTAGLMKRPGFSFIQKIGDSPEYENAKWFYSFRDKVESYFGCIIGDTIKLWDAATGIAAHVVEGAVDGTVTNVDTFTSAYLTGVKASDYDVLTVQDVTYITNKLMVVEVQPKTSWVKNTAGTIKLQAVEYSASYIITIDDIEYIYNTRDGDNVEYDPDHPDQHTDVLDSDEILNALKEAIDAGSSGVEVIILKNSLELSKDTEFNLQARGGITNEALESYQDTVENVAKLSSESVHDRTVKIINTASEKDSYYTQFTAEDGVQGSGYWEESRGQDASPGLEVDTMPHNLLSLGMGRWVWNDGENKYDFETDENEDNRYTFMFKAIEYTERLVGDEETNTDPSFVGNTIQQTFFFSNRLGFLTEDNVSMSQSGEYKNFYHISALAQTDADPVDISCSSIRPALLSGVVPVAQGLILFSKTQQFLMYSDDGNLSPTTVIISTLSNYEYDIDIEPVNTGTRVNFISKTKHGKTTSISKVGLFGRTAGTKDEGYARIFGMMPQGVGVEPTVLDISAVVADWIPSSVDQMIASPQNQFIAIGGVNNREIYFFRTHSDGQKDVMQAWYKWIAPGNVQAMVVQNDTFSVIIEAGGEYSIIQCILNVIQDGELTVLDENVIYGAPCIDMYASPKEVTYDGTNSYLELPYADITELTPSAIFSVPFGTDIDDYPDIPSISMSPTRDPNHPNKFVLEGIDLTSYADSMIVGYKYALDVTLPTVYFQQQSEGPKDITASLTVARMKFIVGLSEKITFKLNAQGSDEWNDVNPVIIAQPYVASKLSVDRQALIQLPIHQRNNHFNVRVYSESPFPVSLVSMTWEGNYSPRFYRRT